MVFRGDSGVEEVCDKESSPIEKQLEISPNEGWQLNIYPTPSFISGVDEFKLIGNVATRH